MPDRARAELLRRQARALGDPTRHEIFCRIDEAETPLGVRELADQLGLHPSAVRQHLAKLIAAELVTEVPQPPSGRGRPRSVYERSAGVLGVWTTDNPFERLAALLVDVVRTRGAPRVAGREAGRRIATARAGGDQLAGADALTGLVEAQGFEPLLLREDGEATIVLRRCPYASLATIAPEVVCELHRGLAEGMADGLGGTEPVEVAGLTRVDPVTGGCRIAIRRRIATVNARQNP